MSHQEDTQAGETWVRVGSLADVPPDSVRGLALGGRPLALVHANGRLSALENRCPHRGGPLSEGKIHDNQVVCPWHGFRFHAQTGQATCPTPYVAATAVPVRVLDGSIEVLTAAPGEVRWLETGESLRTHDVGARPSALALFGELAETLESEPHRTAGLQATYQFLIVGPGGGEWSLRVGEGQATMSPGRADAPDITVTIAERDFVDMKLGILDGTDAFMSGKIRVEGDISLAMRLPVIMA